MSNWQDSECNYKRDSWPAVVGGILRGWSWPYAFQMLINLGENSVTYYWPFSNDRKKVVWQMVQKTGHWLQINVFFNSDSNKVLSLGIKKATFPYGHFPQRSAVKQVAILLVMGQNINSQSSDVAEGAGVTLDVHTVSLVGARTFITSSRGYNCCEAARSCGMHRPGGLLWNWRELKDKSWEG